MADDEVSLRPLSLRPGGGKVTNPFAGFAKGAGVGIRVTQAASVSSAPKKKTGETIKYTQEFLLKFLEKNSRCPVELQQQQFAEIVLTEDDPDRHTQRQTLQRVVEDVDDNKDWRARGSSTTPAPSRSYQQQPSQRNHAENNNNNNNSNKGGSLPKLETAADKGRTAYKPGAMAAGGIDVAVKRVKGILNKLTPEKFDRLLAQLLEVVTTAEILQHTITLVFENAVAQPTFCALYAELCLKLSKELPEFPPKEGETKPMTFKRVLLNTCQDEFEAAANAREDLKTMAKGDSREAAERKVKLRTLGNIRLISELYKKQVVNERIMHVCIRDLLTGVNPNDQKSLPPEENIEAVCEIITTAGKQLAASAAPPTDRRSKPQPDALSGYLARLERIGGSKELPSRIRFLIRDVLDLKKNNWVPRRETYTAKKLEEVRAQAEAELGLIPSNLAAKLPTLPALQQQQQHDDRDLLPPLRGEDGWETVGKRGTTSGRGFAPGSSALMGEYKPPEPAAPRPAPVQAAPVPAPVAEPTVAPKADPSKPLTEEEFLNKCSSFLREFLSVRDAKEALTCVKELRAAPSTAVPEAQRGAKIASATVDELLNSTKDAEQEALVGLVVSLVKEGGLRSGDVDKALAEKVAMLEDLSLDVPLAPKLLGRLTAAAVTDASVPLASLPTWLKDVESCEPKRAFAAAVFRGIKSRKSEDVLKRLAIDAGIKAGAFLEADPEFDGELPSVAEFLKGEGVSVVPV